MHNPLQFICKSGVCVLFLSDDDECPCDFILIKISAVSGFYRYVNVRILSAQKQAEPFAALANAGGATGRQAVLNIGSESSTE